MAKRPARRSSGASWEVVRRASSDEWDGEHGEVGEFVVGDGGVGEDLEGLLRVDAGVGEDEQSRTSAQVKAMELMGVRKRGWRRVNQRGRGGPSRRPWGDG